VPYHDFDADLASYVHKYEPYTFRLGGHDFTTLSEPMFGDVVELWSAPEPEVDEQAAVFAVTQFIRRLLVPQERDAFDRVLYTIPNTAAVVVLMQIGAGIAEYYTRPFRDGQDSSSQRPPEPPGPTPRPSGDLVKASSKSKPGGRSVTSTGISGRAGMNGKRSS